jgi:prevent-host-death family protein
MATITLRELARNTASVIQGIQSSGRPALVTRNGKPVVALVPIDELALEEWLLKESADITRTVAAADPDLDAGRLQSVEWRRARETTESDTDSASTSPPRRLRGSHRGN